MSENAPPQYPTSNVPIDWQQIERWDRSYYLHSWVAQDEYAFTGVEKTDGNYLYLADGTRLLDFRSQFVSDSMGHRHPRVHEEIRRAMERYGHVMMALATDYRARAAKLVIDDILGGEKGWAGRVRFLCSGTEGAESAMDMARVYTRRPIILTQVHSFHGMTVGATMLRGFRTNVTPVDSPNEIRDVPGFTSQGFMPIPAPEFHDWEGDSPLPSLVATEHLIQAVGPENIAAVITETMFGAGAYLPHDRYLPELCELTKRYGILWIDDEVICGFGRLGEWFGYQLFDGIEPDLMVVGKSLNGCALPIGGVVASRPIAEFFERARWWNGSTNEAHPLVCASIVGNLETMIEEEVVPRVARLGRYLEGKLREIQKRHPCVGRVGGRGLYYAVDLVNAQGEPIVPEDRFTGYLGDLSKYPSYIIAGECAKRGVFLGGVPPNTVQVAPPFTITEDEIDLAMNAFDEALNVLDRQIGAL